MTIKELYEKAKAEGKEDYEIYYFEDSWSICAIGCVDFIETYDGEKIAELS